MAASSYVSALRRSIGHDLLLLPAVAVLAFDDEGRLLLVRQADDGAWATVGGALEPDESPVEAAVREAAEETGLVVEVGALRGVFGGRQFRHSYPNGDVCSYVAIVFEATVVGGEARPDGEETTELGWFDLADLPLQEVSEFTLALFEAVGLLAGG